MKILNFLFLLYCCLHITLGHETKNSGKTRVCVIGAGAAGISATRHLADYPEKFDITVFEKASQVGGTWVYSNKTNTDDHGYAIHSSMYKNLRTNLPKEIMNFPDWPVYQGVNESCVPHKVILEYLNNYTDHFNIRQYIQFNTIVEKVELVKNNDSDQWKVTVKNFLIPERNELTFDAVVICNGHYFKPNIPRIPGLQDFSGKILHSHEYRDPEFFRNKKVIVLGAGSSGVDISQELVNVTSEVYLSHNRREKIAVSLNQIAGVDRFEDGKFVLKDNSTTTADVILFCTGYNYEFSFLDSSSGITVDEDFVSPLYKHIFNIAHPSMSFIGISTGIIPFPMFHQQSQYVASVLTGKSKLPTLQVLREDSKLKTSNKRQAHGLTNLWVYTDELARLGSFKPIPEYYKVGHHQWMDHWHGHWDDFKDYNMIIEKDNNTVKIFKPEQSKSLK